MATVGDTWPVVSASQPGQFSRVLGLAVILLSGIVFVEPAPTDLLFPVLFFCAVAQGYCHFYTASLPAYASLAVLTVLVTGSMFAAEDVGRALRYGGITIYLAALWFVFHNLFLGSAEKYRQRAMLTYVAVAWISAIVAVLAYHELIPAADRFLAKGRATALFEDPNVFGPFLVPPLLFCLAKPCLRETRHPAGWFVAALCMAIAVVHTFSRGAAVNLLASVLVFCAFVLMGRIRGIAPTRTMLAGLVGVSCFGGVLYAFSSSSPSFQQVLTARTGMQDYDNDRWQFQRRAMQEAVNSPWGIGPGHAELTFDFPGARGHGATHNLFLRVLVENGWLAVMALVVFLVSVMLPSWAKLGWDGASPSSILLDAVLLASLVGMLVNSLVIDSLHWRHLWLCLAMLSRPPVNVSSPDTA